MPFQRGVIGSYVTACVQVCQLLKDVGRQDLVPTVTERVRTLFWRLQPCQLAALLAWLPTDHAAQLLQMEV